MNNDLEQFSEERLKDIIELADNPTMTVLARIALSAKQAKPIGFVGKSYAMTYFMPPQDSGVEIDDLIYTIPQPAHTERVIPDGWKLVPIEPTPAMCEAGYTARDKWNSMQCDNQKELHFSFSQPRYKAMLAAAPKPESE